MVNFGDFGPLCSRVPSYSWCNLFYRRILKHTPGLLSGVSRPPRIAPVGINPRCGILRVKAQGSVGNVANIVACGLSILFVLYLVFHARNRKFSVGYMEFQAFLLLYGITLALQLLSTGALLEQGSTILVVITAFHAGAIAALFCVLLGNAIVATQVVEDGAPRLLALLGFITLAVLVLTTYISMDIAFGYTTTFAPPKPPQALNSIPLFVLTTLWPAIAALLYFAIMLYVTKVVFNETRPTRHYIISVSLFLVSQIVYYLASSLLCTASKAKVDGSFLATLFQTASVGALHLARNAFTHAEYHSSSSLSSL